MRRAFVPSLALALLVLASAFGRSQEKPMIESRLEVMTVATTEREVVYSAPAHFEAPNWSRDGKTLLFNQEGRIQVLPLDTRKPAWFDSGTATRCNNDHGLSPDGKWLAVSHAPQNDSLIYVLPASRRRAAPGHAQGPVLLARLVTRRADARLLRPAQRRVRRLHDPRRGRRGDAADDGARARRRPGLRARTAGSGSTRSAPV